MIPLFRSKRPLGSSPQPTPARTTVEEKLRRLATLAPEEADALFPDQCGEGMSFGDNGFRQRLGLPLLEEQSKAQPSSRRH